MIKNENNNDLKIIINFKEDFSLNVNDNNFPNIILKEFNCLFSDLISDIRDNNLNLMLNQGERKFNKIYEVDFKNISNSIFSIFNITESDKLIGIMKKYLDEMKKDEEIKKEEKTKNFYMKKKKNYENDLNEYRKYEIIENILNDGNSDLKIQQFFKKKIESMLFFKSMKKLKLKKEFN